MMEVGTPSLQNVGRIRRNEKMFSPEGRSPSVDTGLPLGVPAGDNKGASMLPQDTGRFPSVSNMPVPLSSTTIGGYASVTGIETVTMSPSGSIDGISPPVPPLIPAAANWTTPIMPQHSYVEPSLPNLGSTKEFDKGVLRDGGNGNIVIPPIAVPVHAEGTRVDIDDHQLNMATQPAYLGESQASQADFNNIYSCGETQLVHDNQVGLDDTQPPFSGDTQPVNGHEGFDDMVILQNNTLTASAIPLTNAGQSVSLEPIQGTDAQPLQSFDIPAFTPMGNNFNNGISASYESNAWTGKRETYTTADGPNEVTEAPTVNEHPEVHPAETAGQLGRLTEGKEKDTNTSKPQPSLLDKDVNEKGKADEGMMAKDGEAEIGVKDYVTGKAKVVSEQDIQAIKGRKVVKKFGRKNYGGEVVGYDAENQWFKVVYEDGDEEDLELLEVKEILLTEDTPSNPSTAKRKRLHPEGAVNDQLARKRKRKTKRKGAAAGAQKKSQAQQVKSPPGSKSKGLKRSAKFKSSLASAYESPVQSQPTSGAKRKRSSDVKTMTSSKLELEDIGGKVKSRGKKQSGNAKTPRKSSTKVGGKARPKKNSARKKGTMHRSLSKLQTEESKVDKALEAGEGEKGRKPKGKRQKIDASEDLVGKSVKKDFDGTLYRGVVAKFDKKTKYYKVKYEDGDQEEMELEELETVLVQ